MKKRSYSKTKGIDFTPGSLKYTKKTYSKPSSDHKLLMALKKNVFQHEKKYCDFNSALQNTTLYVLGGATAVITLLNGLSQGVDETGRIGRQVNMKSIFLRGEVNSNSSSSGSGTIRTMIVLDQEVPQSSGSGVTMSITDFLVSNQVQSQNNLNNRKRFKVLWDDIQNLAGYATNSGCPTSISLYYYKKIDITCEFNSNDNGTITDFTKNAMYLITYCGGDMAVQNPQSTINTRIRFTDN